MTTTSIEYLRFCLTDIHPCSYLEDQEAVTLFVAPNEITEMQQYQQLAQLGFRRSGSHVYRPHCSHCAMCIPVRLNVNEFKPSRSQKRNLKANSHITYQQIDTEFHEEHYSLYRKYMKNRHAGGGMDTDDVESYRSLICSEWSNSVLLEFRDNNKLVMIALADIFSDGISAVYTFFDPDNTKSGLGVYGILSEIDYARTRNMQWLYLGYWNPKTPKMSYKNQYKPIEFFDGNSWQLLSQSGM